MDSSVAAILTTEYGNIISVFSFFEDEPIMLGAYYPRNHCVIYDNGTLHISSSGGVEINSYTVYEVADGGEGLDTVVKYGCDGSQYYEVIDGGNVTITKERYDELTYLHHIDREDNGKFAFDSYIKQNFTPIFDHSDIANDMYDAALSGKIGTIDRQFSTHSFKEYIREINSDSFDINVNGKAFVDMDGDGMDELVISINSKKQTDTIILRYYAGNVYIYGFYFRNLYHLNTDGSFSWNHDSAQTYGESKLIFNGADVEQKELWRIVNDGASSALYYIDGVQVSEDEIQSYFKKHPKTRVVFVAFELDLDSSRG